MQEARFVIDDLLPNHAYEHRLMDYNNDPVRTVAGIQNALKLIEDRITRRSSEQAGVHQSAPSVTTADLQVIPRAQKLLDSAAKWNRADEPHCPANAKTFSLYCALKVSAREAPVAEDANTAMRETRNVIVETAPNQARYDARLTDFNADPITTSPTSRDCCVLSMNG